MAEIGAGGLSRRHFLVAGGGGAALLWAGWTGLARRAPGGPAAAGPVAAVRPATAPGLRELPFADAFADPALPSWNVRRPVAILGTTAFGFGHPANAVLDRPEVLQGRGTVIGLDGPLAGSTGPGLLETVDAFVFEPGATYRLAFSVAGSQQRADRLPPSTLTASLPGLGVSRQVTRRPADGFLEVTLDAPVTGPALSTIVLASENAPGQAGLLLESVSLTKLG